MDGSSGCPGNGPSAATSYQGDYLAGTVSKSPQETSGSKGSGGGSAIRASKQVRSRLRCGRWTIRARAC